MSIFENYSIDVSDDELPQAEAKLLQQGYKFSSKLPGEELSLGEYSKSSYHGSANSFEGPKRWNLSWHLK